MEFRDLKKQYAVLKQDIDAAMIDVVSSGAYIGGRWVGELEKEMADYVGVRHAVSCANGTDALSLALMAWGVGSGDAVFVPDFTFFASAEVVATAGATPIFVDVDKDTFNISTDDLQRAIEQVINEGRLKAKVIIAVDLFGLPANYPKIREIATKYNLLVLEDSAQGFGGAIDGKRACSFGDISTTSFFPAKPLGCYGDGGMIFTDNDEWADLMRSFKVHGKGRDKYDNVRIGVNSRLDSIQAAILQIKFRAFKSYELDDINRVAALYTERLKDMFVCPTVPSGYYSSWAQYTLRFESKEQRDTYKAKLSSAGIPSMVYYPAPMHSLTAFEGLNNASDICPTATMLCDCVLSLPIHPYMSKEDVMRVTEILIQ